MRPSLSGKIKGKFLEKDEMSRGQQLFVACMLGDVSTVQQIITDVSAAELPGVMSWSNDRSFTPVYVACMHGHAKCLKLLVNKGADVNQPSRYGVTPLMAAAYGGPSELCTTQECVLVLLNANADIKCTDMYGKTAADIAAEYDHPELAKLIRLKQANDQYLFDRYLNEDEES
eukprot:CAMPEP_0119338726 /NCGR_PEP_ID=MMETSP1333-20130426/96754_1 /TAXON_ID=418940 /ORGANISM="Scyphosphaera apsteinii, Strain RCC1455" /LENGTH=172 /DNA_ID=CAMNT_0007350083 /DNA_START=113 /DNA_END=631 /DNA_ORIENTATION=-